MKFFTNKSIWSKIVIVLVMILLLQFCLSRPVHAEDDGLGGKLLSPIVSLVLALGDGIVDLLHSSVMGQDESLIRIDMSDAWWQKALSVLVGIVAGVLIIAAIVLTGGVAAVVAGAVGITATVSVGVGTILAGVAGGVIAGVWFDNSFYPDDLYLPLYTYSPEEIFKGNIALFDIDFFDPDMDIYMETKDGNEYKLKDYTDKELDEKAKADGGIKYYFYKDNGEKIITSKQNTAYDLQGTISKWYVSIRNIVLVLMMSVLLYIGIRMLLSSISSEKAKYKQMLIDWTVSICLIFFMHYIMAFSVTIVKNLTTSITAINNDAESTGYTVTLEEDEDEKLTEKLEELGMEDYISEATIQTVDEDGSVSDKDTKLIVWPTNLMGSLRIQAQMSNGDATFIGYTICFLMLVFYTMFFTFTYLKRVLYLAFLTIIAPFVALTYPIDKISDGSAQGFNKWLKEYVFNLLIQPLHLVLYTILVSAAFELAGTNVIYSIIAIGFLIPAEKLLRSLFGFEKASTPGSLAGAAIGASLINQGLNKVLHKKPSLPGGKKGNGGNGGDGGSSADGGDSKINFQDDKFDAYQTLGDMGNTNLPNSTNNPNMPNGGVVSPQQSRSVSAGIRTLPNRLGLGINNFATQKATALKDGITNSDLYRDMSERNQQFNDKHRRIAAGKRKIRGVASGVGRSAAGVGRVGMTGARKLYAKRGDIAKKAIRMSAGAATAIAAGTVGTAVGAATGDLGNAFQYGVGAAGAGAIAGSNLADFAMETGSAIKNSDDVQRAYYGDRYEEHKTQQNIKEWKKNNRTELENEYGIRETSRMMNDGTIDQYLKADITSTKDIIALEKMQKDKEVGNFDQARAVHKLSKMTGDTTKMKAKDRKDWQETMKNKYIDKNYNEKQAEEASAKSINLVDKYYKNRK